MKDKFSGTTFVSTQELIAILFWKGEPMKIQKLAEISQSTYSDTIEALRHAEQVLSFSGLQLIYKDDEVMLGTGVEHSGTIEKLAKEELSKDLGKAGLETLSIILYRGPVSRKDIDYIRGVNSNFIVRNLLVRGLVEKILDPQDERRFLYKPTFELLSFLGLGRIEDLPEYNDVRKEIESHAVEESHSSE